MGRKTLPNPTRTLKSPFAEILAPAKERIRRALETADRAVSAGHGADPVRTTPMESAMQEVGKTILRMEMRRAGVGYAGLADLLVKMGMPENEPNVRNKIARGKFSMGYFLACLRALGTKTINLDIEVPKADIILAGSGAERRK